MSKNFIDEIIGWYGMVAILLAYGLVSFGFLSVSNIFYQVLNFTGAGGGSHIFHLRSKRSSRLF